MPLRSPFEVSDYRSALRYATPLSETRSDIVRRHELEPDFIEIWIRSHGGFEYAMRVLSNYFLPENRRKYGEFYEPDGLKKWKFVVPSKGDEPQEWRLKQTVGLPSKQDGYGRRLILLALLMRIEGRWPTSIRKVLPFALDVNVQDNRRKLSMLRAIRSGLVRGHPSSDLKRERRSKELALKCNLENPLAYGGGEPDDLADTKARMERQYPEWHATEAAIRDTPKSARIGRLPHAADPWFNGETGTPDLIASLIARCVQVDHDLRWDALNLVEGFARRSWALSDAALLATERALGLRELENLPISGIKRRRVFLKVTKAVAEMGSFADALREVDEDFEPSIVYNWKENNQDLWDAAIAFHKENVTSLRLDASE
jgi:hypothetical protein